MEHADTPLSPLKRLAAQWRALALYLIACMRAVRWMEDAGSARALARAETLEACLHVALHEIHSDIAREAAALPKSASKDDKDAIDGLRFFACMIMAMIMILQHIKLRLVINYASPVWAIPAMASVPHRATPQARPLSHHPP